MRTLFDFVKPGGAAIVSKIYHGISRTSRLYLSGFYSHFKGLWVNGHSKFWSMPTVAMMLAEAGSRFPAFECADVSRLSPCL